jgi:hypothetical protein
MRIDLEVPFAEKDLAKKRGARWDLARQVWYIENPENILAFWKWMPAKYKTKPVAKKPKKK